MLRTATEPVLLRGITWEHPRGLGSMVAAAAAYRELTGVQVHWEHRSLQAFADAPLDELARRYDLLVIDHPHVPAAAEAGLLAQLDGAGLDAELAELAADSVGASHHSYSHQGHQWGLASDAAAQVAGFRPDLMAEPPRDWPAVLELAREGRVLWPAKPIDAYSSLVTVAAGLDPAGDFLEPSATAAALELLHRLAAAVPADCLTQNPIQVAERLASGERYAYAPLLFGYTNYSRRGFRGHLLRYTDIPCHPEAPAARGGPVGSLLGGAGIAVSAMAAEPDEARRFAVWVAGPEAQCGVYFDGGGQPGHGRAWSDDRLNELTSDFFRGTRATLDGACLRPRTVGYLQFQDVVSPLVTAALKGELSDDQLLDRIEQERNRADC